MEKNKKGPKGQKNNKKSASGNFVEKMKSIPTHMKNIPASVKTMPRWKLYATGGVLLGVIGLSVGIGVGVSASSSNSNKTNNNSSNSFVGNSNVDLEGFDWVNGQLQDSQMYSGTDSKNFDFYKDFKSKTFTQKAVDAAKAILSAMQTYGNTDWQWHTIGEPMIDAWNMLRYVIKTNDSTLKTHLKSFIDEMFTSRSTVSNNNEQFDIYSSSSSAFKDRAKKDIWDWLSGSKDTPYIVTWFEHGKDYKDASIFKPASRAELDKMNPVRLDVKAMTWGQYRTQQVEWKGDFDGHSWSKTNDEITSSNHATHVGNATNGIPQGITIKAPVFKQAGPGAESYVFPYSASQSSVPEAIPSATDHVRQNIYTAFASVVSTMFDHDDGSQTSGHRSNLLRPTIVSGGYSYSFTHNHSPYLFMHVNEAGLSDGIKINQAFYDARKNNAEFNWIKDIYGEKTYNFIVEQNTVSPLEILKLHARYLFNGNNQSMTEGMLKDTGYIIEKTPATSTTAATYSINLDPNGNFMKLVSSLNSITDIDQKVTKFGEEIFKNVKALGYGPEVTQPTFHSYEYKATHAGQSAIKTTNHSVPTDGLGLFDFNHGKTLFMHTAGIEDINKLYDILDSK